MRTKRSVKNIISTFVSYIVLGVLGFIKVKIFVAFLKDDLYSLNQFFYQVLGYLTLVDAGFGLLISQKMYKAFSDDNKNEINEIYSTAKKFFRNVGLIILGMGIVVSFVIHLFTKANIPRLYIQVVFIIFLIRNIVDYFFCAPRYVISADQKMYKINYLINSIRFFQIISEIILLVCGFDYLIVLIPSIFIAIIINIIINKKVYKEYDFLEDTKVYNKKYLKGTKDIIMQKISGIIYSNTDIVLLSAFVSPISVIIYTSYNYITKLIQDTSYIIADAITPSFANAVNDKKNNTEYKIYSELSMIFYFVASFFVIMLYLLMNSFIKFWIGSKYVVGSFSLLLFIIILYLFISMRTNYMVINSCGLFKETKGIIFCEAIINLILSIILVFFFGMNGILIGTIVSTLVSTYWYLPYIIHKKVFNESVKNYYIKNFIIILINVIIIGVIYFIKLPSINNFLIWILYGFIYSFITLIILFIVYYSLFDDFRNLLVRGKYFIESKKNTKKVGEK